MLCAALPAAFVLAEAQPEAQPWPPALPGAVNGVATVTGPELIQIPDSVKQHVGAPGASSFVVAKTAPVIDVVYHAPLPSPGINGTGWSAWGDICVASDGNVYVGTGDHGPDKDGTAEVFIYRYDPKAKQLTLIAKPNEIAGMGGAHSSWSKIHARIDEGPDGHIYYIPTFNDGQQAPTMNWPDTHDGSIIFQYNPKTGENKIVGQLPRHCSTATSQLDKQRNILYANLERGGKQDALFAFDLSTMQPIFAGPGGMISKNRNFAVAKDGSVYYNGKAAPHGGNVIGRYDAVTRTFGPTRSTLPGGGMRATTRQAADGWIYGAAMGPGQLFRYHPGNDEVELLGLDFLDGSYTTVTVLSPDEKYVYYLPGAHGGSWKIGCPVVQYDIAKKQRKVIAFLRPLFEAKLSYVPNGTYGTKISADGATLYVNLNGHAADRLRLEGMNPGGFGLTGLAAIHIPESER
ncbi:MAG: hypothetical protein CMJ49_06200 [Planctomycetaceae bacterium]|nr:hypothetical protein [Planctomycetaceae bacterium]